MQNMIFRDYIEEFDHDRVVNCVCRNTSRPNILDIGEKLGISQIQKDCRIWEDVEGDLQGMVLVDDYQNLCIDVADDLIFSSALNEALPWALEISQIHFNERALDLCEYRDTLRLSILKQRGFIETGLRTLRYQFSCWRTMIQGVVPAEYIVRPLKGESEIHAWLDLHLAVHPEGQLDEEYRRSMMAVPGYRPDLDYVMEYMDGTLVAYCVGNLEKQSDGSLIGFTDPVAVHPAWHRKGLGQAIMQFCMQKLMDEGASLIEVMTSSENLPMQRLAESVGFKLIEEKSWLRLEE